VDRAVKAASKAFEPWKKVAARERGKLLMKIVDELEEQAEEIARTTAMETGNALRPQSRPEAKQTADLFRYMGGVAGEIKGETIPLGENVLCYTRREPLGVVGGIIPWNSRTVLPNVRFPCCLSTGKKTGNFLGLTIPRRWDFAILSK
jgi:betaine-aldehyde dehydrogenase